MLNKLPHDWLFDIMNGEPIQQKVFIETGKKSKWVEQEYYPDFKTRFAAAKAAAPFFAGKKSEIKSNESNLESILKELFTNLPD